MRAKEYEQQYSEALAELRSRGCKITSPYTSPDGSDGSGLRSASGVSVISFFFGSVLFTLLSFACAFFRVSRRITVRLQRFDLKF
jgi:hypothetical protein